MGTRRFICLVLASTSIFCCQNLVGAEKLKLCVVDSVHTTRKVHKHCQEFVKLGSQIECVVGNDRYNCLRRLTIGDSDFTVLEPEDLIAATVHTEDNVLVTNELRLFPNEKQRFEVIALVNKDVKGLSDLRDKRFCHPGYEATDDWTQVLATYFENRVIPKECDPNKTLVENRMSSLSTFFAAACIAGAWTPDSTLDRKLKSRYRNLCALCNNPAGCYSGDKYHGREGSLLCLTDNVGDVAWVRLDDARQHFKAQSIDEKNFNYLCPDGTTRPIRDMMDPCVWMSKPWPVIVARIDVAERVSQMMKSLNVQKLPWQNSLVQLLENYHVTPVSTYNLLTPEDFLQKFPGFISASSRANCQPSRSVRWCVASNLEDLKCRWLREASFIYGIEPSISCVQESNRTSCLESVRSRRNDLFVTRPEEELEARKNGLEPILHAFTNKREDLNKVVAVVRTNAPFKYLKDLEGAKACFTGYRSIGWNAFESIMRDKLGTNWDCSDTRAIGRFFEDSCVFGLDKKNDDTPSNLHSLCEQGEAVGAEQSTFDCLTSGRGDVAFVSVKTIVKNTGSSGQRDGLPSLNSTDFKYLWIDESNLEEDPSILTWTTLGSVMLRKNISDLRRNEIYSMLLEMDLLFGRTFKEQTAAFSLYGVYDANRSVIFPEETQHLQRDLSHVQLVRSYSRIVDKLLEDPSCNSAGRPYIRFVKTTICLCTVIILNQISMSIIIL